MARADCTAKTCKYFDRSMVGNCALSFCAYKSGNENRKLEDGSPRENFIDDVLNHLSEEELEEFVKELETDTIFEETPVGIREFILSPDYLNFSASGSIWEEVLLTLEEMFSGKYEEAYVSAGLGAGKSTLASLAMLYVAYRILIVKDPHTAYRLVQGHPIEILNLSVNENLAKEVVFSYCLAACENSTFFKNPKYAPDKTIRSRLMFKKNVCISYGNGSKNAAIGRNVIFGVLDEVAFYPVTAGSDRAKIQFDNVSRRIKSRFAKHGIGKDIFKGLILSISSPCHQDDFMEKAFRRRNTSPNAYYKRATSFETKDLNMYCGRVFRFCIDCKKIVKDDHIRHGYDIFIPTKHRKEIS